MGEYVDYDMTALGGDKPVTGICHARGMNANVPAQWMIYITVADLEQAMAQCQAVGGRIINLLDWVIRCLVLPCYYFAHKRAT